MIKQSRVSQKSWVSMFTGAALLVGSMGSLADTGTAVTFGDEDITGGVFQISSYFSGQVTTFSLSAPFVCGKAGTPSNTGAFANNWINPYFAGSIPGNGSFLFGGGSAGIQTPLQGFGAWTFSPSQGLVVSQGDPALVCYSLSSSGARKPTAGLFSDTFDLPFADANVSVRVVQLPNFGNNFVYRYFIDVNIPVVSPTVAVPFGIRDGYDSSVFTPPGSSAGAGYCEVNIGDTSCSSVVQANLDQQVSLSPGTSYSKRFIVSRPLRGDVASLPNTGKPLVIAGVFSQAGLEDRLDNNVSSGFGSLSDFDPIINTTGTNLTGLSEGGILPGVTFSLSDDTTESAGQLLDARVTVDFNGTLVPATTNCGSATPQAGPGSSRTCTFDVVPPGPNFATDLSHDTYANGVYANVVITATDPAAHSSTRVLQLHIASADNDAPYFVLSPSIAPPDAGNGNTPTITCSLANSSSASCQFGGSPPPLSGFVSGLAPGPIDAADERGAQWAFLGLGDSGNGGNFPCALEGANQIFGFGGSPNLASEGGGNYRLTYHLSGAIGSAICDVAAGDGGSYGPHQGYMDVHKPLRIVVTN